MFVFEFRVCTKVEQYSQFNIGCVQVVGIQHAVAASKWIVIEGSSRHIPDYSRSFASFAGNQFKKSFSVDNTRSRTCDLCRADRYTRCVAFWKSRSVAL